MIVYKLTQGQATDLRHVAEDYVLASDESKYQGNELPALDSLHVEPYISANRAATAKAAIQSQIDTIERNAMVPRVVREFMLQQAVITATSLGVTEPALYASNTGYRKVKDIDAQIVKLRRGN